MFRRRRVKQTETLTERLLKTASEAREMALGMPLGKARDELVRKAHQIEASAHLNDWLTSPGLQPPK